ncbi:MAG: YkgJ family cysteine cluster protein [Vicinamibacterales bacterium]
MPPPPADPAGTLCTQCGLCCDGTLFGDVELTGRREAVRLAILGLDVDADDADVELLALPCAALRGTRCGIYPLRPRCCRTFECRLLRAVASGQVTAGAALARVTEARTEVRRVTGLLARLEPRGNQALPLAERVADALASAPAGADRGAARREALAAAMAAVSRTIRSTFLD